MNRLWTIPLAGLMLSGCGATLPRAPLWDDVEALQRPADRERAEQRIRSEGRAGLDGLLLAARTLGDERALKLISERGGGHRFHVQVPMALRESSAWHAALAAHRWLGQEPGLATDLARSGQWFDRALAITSQWGKPAELLALLDALGAEPHPTVNQVLISVLDQTVLQAGSKEPGLPALRERARDLRIAETWEGSRCKSGAPDFGGLLQRARSGQLKKGSHGTRNNVLQVYLNRPDGREVALGADCAMELYRALAAEGDHRPELITPILHWGVVGPDLRRTAAGLVLADLDRIPEDKRNVALARVVNAGVQAERTVAPAGQVQGFEVAEVLEAMARQDPEAARSHLKHFWLCSGVFGNGALIAVSGLADDPQTARGTLEIGQKCEHGLEPALIALLRMEDPRARSLLDQRLKKDFPPIPTEVIYALREHRTEALAEHLKALAASGNAQAKRILSTW